jgi:hypothetical protein
MTTQAASLSAARSADVPRQDEAAYPASSPAFDWTMGGLALLLTLGFLIDGWAHSHGQVDQSFLTPWHAILYSAMALNGLVLGGTAARNVLRRGYPVARALPYGYALALGGVVLFAVGGAADLGWHTLFGIESGIDLLISPSHLVLGLAAALIYTGPLRSVASQYGAQFGGWKGVGPAVPALLSLLILLGFFLGYAQPIEDGFTAVSIQRSAADAHPAVPTLFSISGDDGALRRLPLPDGLDVYGATLAPDGRIAYRAQAARATERGSLPPSDIYVAAPDGRGARRLTHSGRHDTQVAWSPDGSQLAYVSMPAGTSGNFQLDIIRADGSGRRAVVDEPTTLSSPAWSPDGKHLVFASRNGTTDMLAVVDVATAQRRWLSFSAGGDTPLWTKAGFIYAGSDGALHEVAPDGSGARTLVAHGNTPSISPNGRYIAYLSNDRGAAQVYVARADGSGAREVSQLPGIEAFHPAVADDGSVVFTGGGRPPPERSQLGFALSTSALILEAVTLAGVLLLVVRRWRAPLGTFSLILPLFALAMSAQSDYYYLALPALATGIAADATLFFSRERIRSGVPFYAFAFGLTAVFTATYIGATALAAGGSDWTANLLVGTPLLAGIAGLLVAFCYDPPLPEAN